MARRTTHTAPDLSHRKLTGKQVPKPVVVAVRPTAPPQDTTHTATPTEPLEVLGRHQNSGQKDHKGSR
jgi:hypothetical protein